MDTVYYEVTGGAPLEFCRDWRSRTKAIEAEYLAYAESKGGIGNTRYTGSHFGGVIFEGEPPLGWKYHSKPCADGTYFAQPVKRGDGAAEGKTFQKEIDSLPKLPSEDEFCALFGFPYGINYEVEGGIRGALRLSQGFKTVQIGWSDEADSFWVVLPDFAAIVSKYQAKGYTVTPDAWSLPEGMKRSSRARYELAQAAAKVAHEEASA